MLKTLLKKQLLEIGARFSREGKGKSSKMGTVGFALLYGLLCLSLGAMFYSLADSTCGIFVFLGLDWLYHDFVALLALAFAVLGSVFTTYSALYCPKDNELLLSMPIPVGMILTMRILGVWIIGLIYQLLVMVPGFIAYYVAKPPTVGVVLMDLLMILVVSVFVLTLSCLLGYLVAKLTARLKNKTVITVVASLTFLVGYYYFVNQSMDLLEELMRNINQLAERIQGAILPLYWLGKACEGSLLEGLYVTALVAALFGLLWLLLSRSFLKLTTIKAGSARKTVKTLSYRNGSVFGGLLRKEFRRLGSSATYILNCGLGTVMAVGLGVIVLVQMPVLRELVELVGEEQELLYLLACGVICLTASMNDFTAPSVSLEGRSLWILQSLPVTPWLVLQAKLALHLIITLPAVAVEVACIAIALKMDLLCALLILVISAVFVVFCGAWGLFLGLKMPKLDWKTETALVKQSGAVAIALFTGMVLIFGLGILYGMLESYIPPVGYMLLCGGLLTIGTGLLLWWLKTRGSRILERL